MKTTRTFGGLTLLAIMLLSLPGCHGQDPELGPTTPTPPPANMQVGKGGAQIQGGLPGTTNAGSAQQKK